MTFHGVCTKQRCLLKAATYIFRYCILFFQFWVTTRRVLQALVLNKHISSLTLSSAAAQYSPSCLKRSVLAPVSFKPPSHTEFALIGKRQKVHKHNMSPLIVELQLYPLTIQIKFAQIIHCIIQKSLQKLIREERTEKCNKRSCRWLEYADKMVCQFCSRVHFSIRWFLATALKILLH